MSRAGARLAALASGRLAARAVTLDLPGLGRLWIYVPGYSVYTACIRRAIRVTAYISELTLRRSYRDPFHPKKVRSAVDQL